MDAIFPVPAVYTNPDRLEQIMSSSLTNAIKYTENGTVSVSAPGMTTASPSPFQTPASHRPEDLPMC